MTTTQQQMTMLRSARPVGEVAELLAAGDAAELLIEAGYPLDLTARMLAAAIPTQGNVTPEDRLREILNVVQAWPRASLLKAREAGASWHALVEPARWWRRGEINGMDMVRFADEVLASTGRWPRPDAFRRRFGYEPGHKGPGDVPGQESFA